jgi:hypothetical protein
LNTFKLRTFTEIGVIVFALQIGSNPAHLYDAGRSAMYVSTTLGIWRITADGLSMKLTSDEFDGKHSSQHEFEAHKGDYFRLFWVSNHIYLSPDNRYIIYQSNRDCYDSMNSNMSVWRIDLHTNVEQRILEGNAYNTINGFVTDKLALVDQQFLLDVSTGEMIPVALPELPNRSIVDTGFGYIVCETYRDEDKGLSSLHIFHYETTTGTLVELFNERGVFRGFGFSPSGKRAFVEYGTDPNRGSETVMLFDFEKTTTQLLEDVLGETFQELDGVIIRAKWLADNTMLLNTWSRVDNTKVENTWVAVW